MHGARPRRKNQCAKKVYCEDVRLSINNENLCYSALYVPEDTPPLTEIQKEKLFERLAGCYDLSGIKPKSSAKVKFEAWNQATEMGRQQRAKERRAQEEAW